MREAVERLLFRSQERAGDPAILWKDQSCDYAWLRREMDRWEERLTAEGVRAGDVVSLTADFSPSPVAALLALVRRGCIVVPLSAAAVPQMDEFFEISQVETAIDLRAGESIERRTAARADHPVYERLRSKRHAGLVLFSSGSTGRTKAAVHDFLPLLTKYFVPRQARRMLAFLLFDHIGGINTLLYVLSNAGCLVGVESRDPDVVCAAIARHRVEVLPTTPTFLRLLLLSEAWRRHDLSSLRLVTYGTEVMPENTLRRVREALPGAELQQTYGLSELGILRSKSKSSDSLWVRLGGEGFETRVRDGLLEVRAASAMLGYLNAPSPFTDDGWFMTGDAVEVDGEFFRILGRRSEMINVGGQKVFPAEVETVLESMPGVEEAAVTGEPGAITGQIVVARVRLSTAESAGEFRRRMRMYCRDVLPPFKQPQKVILTRSTMVGDRFKKLRRSNG